MTIYAGEEFIIGTVAAGGNTEFDEFEDDLYGLSWSEVCTDPVLITIIGGPSFVSMYGTRLN